MPLATFIEPMLQLPIWGVEGRLNHLYFNLGAPKLEVSEQTSSERGLHRTTYLSGAWGFQSYFCHWRVTQDGVTLACNDFDDGKIARAASTLEGQKLINVSVAPDVGNSILSFDLGGELETWPREYMKDREQWAIRSATGAFAYRGDGQYATGPRHAWLGLTGWRPFR